jgi:hypothetical protein
MIGIVPARSLCSKHVRLSLIECAWRAKFWPWHAAYAVHRVHIPVHILFNVLVLVMNTHAPTHAHARLHTCRSQLGDMLCESGLAESSLNSTTSAIDMSEESFASMPLYTCSVGELRPQVLPGPVRAALSQQLTHKLN